jgi:hypothetical protein
MQKRTLSFTKRVRLGALIVAVCPLFSCAQNLNVSKVCSVGYRQTIDGRCIVSERCWQDQWGQLHCSSGYPFNLGPVLGQTSL